MTTLLAIVGAVCVALGLFTIWAIVRASKTVTFGAPTPAENKIHLAHEQERAKIEAATPTDAAVQEMSNAELEDLANDRTPLAPSRR